MQSFSSVSGRDPSDPAVRLHSSSKDTDTVCEIEGESEGEDNLEREAGGDVVNEMFSY